MSLRERIVDVALSVVGLGAAPDTLALFEDLLGPRETPAVRRGMALGWDDAQGHHEVSTCGLTVGGIWVRAGFTPPELDPPYVNGSAITRLLVCARHRGAWVDAKPGILPSPGDMVGVDLEDDKRDGHVFTVVEASANEDGTSSLCSVDGGETYKTGPSTGRQCITKRSRVWRLGVFGPGLLYDQALDGGPQRRVSGWIDIDKLEAGG